MRRVPIFWVQGILLQGIPPVNQLANENVEENHEDVGEVQPEDDVPVHDDDGAHEDDDVDRDESSSDEEEVHDEEVYE